MAEGEQVLTTAISVSGELAVEAMKLLATAIGKVLEEYFIRRNSAEYRRQIELMRQAKQSTHSGKLEEFKNKVETSRSGMLKPKEYLLAREAGVEFVGLPITMSKQDIKDFAAIAEKSGILYTAVAHPDVYGKNPTYYIAVRDRDLPVVEDAVSILKFERRVKNIDIEVSKANTEIAQCESEIKELKEYIDAKSTLDNVEVADSLSDKERVALEKKVATLENKYGIKDIDDAQSRIDNNTSTIYKDKTVVSTLENEKTKTLLERRKAEANICRNAIQEQSFGKNGVDLKKDGKTSKSGYTVDFDSAVNRDTKGGHQRVVYICDTSNPDHYIVAESKQATYDGKPYLKTEYTVYDNGKSVMVCDDSRCRGKDYQSWANTRNEMRSSLNFSDNVIVFNSKNDLVAYQYKCKGANAITEQEKGNAAILNEQANGDNSYRDYDTIISNLQGSITKRGYSFEQGQEPVNNETGKTAAQMFEENVNVNSDICQNASICQNLSDQLEVYTRLSLVETKMVELQLALMTTPETSDEYKKVSSELDKLKEEQGELFKQEGELSNNRASLENANVAVEMCEEEERSIEEKSIAHEHDTDFDISDKEVGNGEKGLSLDKTERVSDSMTIDEIQEHFTEKSTALKAQQGKTAEKVLSSNKER